MNDRDGSLSARLSVQGFRAAAWASRHVSYPVGRAATRWVGDVVYRLAPSARATVERNLARVLGESAPSARLDAAVREAFRSYCLYWFETFHLRAMPAEEVFERTRFVGLEHIDAALAGGRGALMALPHLGNWDAGGRYVTAKGYRMTAVAEELKPEAAFRLFYEHRRALGMGIVALGSKRVGQELVELLAANHMICLVADRDLTGRGVDVEMFGASTQMPAGPAMLALTTGAPLLPSAVYHHPEGWEVVISPALSIERTDSFRDDVTALTRALASRFERSIAAAPTDWHMFQDYWPERS